MFAYRRRIGEIPETLREAGRQGERHVAALISLAVAGPATVGELAQRLEITTPHASLIVGELARSGLVEREHDEHDRRRVVVSLSARAKPAIAEMRRRNAEPLGRFLAGLDEDETSRFIAHLTTLIACLRDEQPALPPQREGGPCPATRR